MRERLNSIGNWTAYSIPVNNKLKTKLWKYSTCISSGKKINFKHFLAIVYFNESYVRFAKTVSNISLNQVLLLLAQYNFN